MKGAVFFSGQYGSTAQYANWIGEAAGLPVFDVQKPAPNPANFDFLILGSSVVVFKLTIRHWAKRHLACLLSRPVILFTVSGAPPGTKLNGWVGNSLPESFASHTEHYALRGRLDLKSVSLWHRIVLRIGAWRNKDPQAKREELEGFDFMDRSKLEPILERICQLAGPQSTN